MDEYGRNIDFNSFPPVADIGFERIQGQQLVGNSLEDNQSSATVSYFDLENSPYHVSGCPEFINEGNSLPASPQEENSLFIDETNSPSASPHAASSFVSTIPVKNDDNRKSTGGKTTKRKKELKPKLYQHEEPLADPVEEKRRLNAINAKKNRDKKKSKMQELENLVKSLTGECDTLQTSNTKYRKKYDALERNLNNVCQQFNLPVIILPQD